MSAKDKANQIRLDEREHVEKLLLTQLADLGWEIIDLDHKQYPGDKLRRRLHERGEDVSGLMDGAALDRFIDHYQRLTEHQWRELPSRADAVLQLTPDHRILGIGWRCE